MIRFLAALSAILCLFFCIPAFGQSSPEPPPNKPGNSVADLEQLVSTLENDGKRAELIATLRTLIAANRGSQSEELPLTLSGRLSSALTASWSFSRATVAEFAEKAKLWPQQLAAWKAALADPGHRARHAQATAAFIAIFVVGWLAEWASWKLLASARRSLKAKATAGYGERFGRAALRVLLDLVSVAVFAASAYFAALIVSPPPAVQAMALNFVHAYAIGRGLMALARALLWPEAPRPLPISDATAKKLLAWVRRFVQLGVGGYFFIAAIILLGIPRQAGSLLFDILYFLLAALAVAMILTNRHQAAHYLRGSTTDSEWRILSPLRTTLAPIWHILAILYVIAFFAVSAFDIENGFVRMARGTAATLAAVALTLAAIAVARGGRRGSAHILTQASPSRSLTERLATYTPIFRWIVAAALILGATVLACEGWGIQALTWLAEDRGRQLVSAFASIALTLVFAILAWEAASTAIQRYLASARLDESAAALSARRRTLLPLLQKTLLAFLSVMVVLITFSEIGIDIAPLLAGAGVAGLAIGFGAQRLVQDVITGFFMLVEDAVAVGDVVAVAGISGVVEDMSVRALKLRDTAGTLHTVPFSTVTTVSNMTKNFSYYVLDIAVAYDEDPDQVADVCRTILAEMRQEASFRSIILEPLDVLGLDSFGESAIVIKARIKTRPIKQWFVGREFNKRMKQRFDTLGIEFPYPHRTIYFGSGDDTPTRPASSSAVTQKKEAAP
ncbi:MAG: mechanosensitive ion channel [Rhodospirillales bacterium]